MDIFWIVCVLQIIIGDWGAGASPKRKAKDLSELPKEMARLRCYPPIKIEKCHSPPTPKQPVDDVKSLSTWQLIELAEKDLPVYKGEAVLLFGTSGSSKSAVALALTTPLNKLQVYSTQGELFVIMEPNATSEVTQMSKALQPQLYKGIQTTILEFPFHRQHSGLDSKLEFTMAYLNRKVITKLSSVKILLTVQEEAISGESNVEINSLFNSVAALIKNPEDFKHSIGLVITKVANYGPDGKFRSDEHIRKGVKNFLFRYRQNQPNANSGRSRKTTNNVTLARKAGKEFRVQEDHTEVDPVTQQQILENRRQLIDFITVKGVGIFRFPERCGKLHNSNLAIQNKEQILDLIDSLDPVTMTNNTFLNPLSDSKEMKSSIKQIQSGLKKNLTKTMNEVVSAVQSSLLQSPGTSGSKNKLKPAKFEDKQKEVEEGRKALKDLINKLQGLGDSPKEFGKVVKDYLRKQKIKTALAVKINEQLDKIGEKMEFLETLAKSEGTPESLEIISRHKGRSLTTGDQKNHISMDLAGDWKELLDETSKEYEIKSQIYELLDSLRKHVASWYFHSTSKPSKPNVLKSLIELKVAFGNNKIKFVNESILGVFEAHKDILSDEIAMIEETLMEAYYTPKVECDSSSPPIAKIKGTFVRGRDMVNAFCSGKRADKVVVFATRVFNANDHVTFGKSKSYESELAILSPQFNVHGPTNYYLSGLDGANGRKGRSSKTAAAKEIPFKEVFDKVEVSKMSANAQDKSAHIQSYEYTDSQFDIIGQFNLQNRKQIDLKENNGIHGKKIRHGYVGNIKGQRKRGNVQGRSLERPPLNGIKVPIKVRDYCKDRLTPDGKSGANGEPGQHGYPGGNFIVLCLNSDSSSNLRIHLEGGSGGNGGAGENGGDGTDGIVKALSSPGYFEFYHTSDKGPCFGQLPRRGSRLNEDLLWMVQKFDMCAVGETSGHPLGFLSYVYGYAGGCPGGIGGNGGNGGGKGENGDSGAYFAIGNQFAADVFKTATFRPTSGSGGKKGSGGKRGAGDWTRIWVTRFVDLGACDGHFEYLNVGYSEKMNQDAAESIGYTYSPVQWSTDGSSGSAGANSKGQLSKKSASYKLVPTVLYSEFLQFTTTLPFPPHPSLEEFNHFIDYSNAMLSRISHIDLGKEMDALERDNLRLKIKKTPRIEIAKLMLPRYQSLVNRLDGYVKLHRPTQGPVKKFLSILFSMAVNELRIFKQVTGTPVITEVKTYLESTGPRIKNYQKIKTEDDKLKKIQEQTKEFTDVYDRKIEEVMTAIAENVEPAIEKAKLKLKQLTQQLTGRIDKWMAQNEEDEKELQAVKKDAERRKTYHTASGFVGTFAGILKNSGLPVVPALGYAIDQYTQGAEHLILGEEKELKVTLHKPSPKLQKYGTDILKTMTTLGPDKIKQCQFLLDHYKETHKTSVQQLEEEKKKGTTDKTTLGKIVGFLADIGSNIESLGTQLQIGIETAGGKKMSPKEYSEYEKKLKNRQDGIVNVAERFVNSNLTSSDFVTTITSAFKTVIKSVVIVSIDGASYEKVKGDQKKINQVAEMIEEAEDTQSKLASFKDNVDGYLGPYSESVIDSLLDNKRKMANGSEVSNRIEQLDMQSKLRELKTFLVDFTTDFPESAMEFSTLITSLEETTTMMADLYAYIPGYLEQKRMAEYQANLLSPAARSLPFTGEERELYLRIERSFLASQILSEWDNAYQNFLQWVFPFGEDFESSFPMKATPDYLGPATKNISMMLDLLIPEVLDWNQDLITELGKYKSGLSPAIDGKLFRTSFNSSYSSSTPFFRWEWEQFPDEVRRFLSGKKVRLTAKPDFVYKEDIQAVKFNLAEIVPKGRNTETARALQKNFQNLRVEMVHSGISNYIMDDDYYEFVGEKTSISYNYERDEEGKRLGISTTYDKLLKGDIILSPYTTWTVQLFPATKNVKVDFSALAKLSKSVDIELIGKGTFVRKETETAGRHGKKGKDKNKGKSKKNKGKKTKRSQIPLYYERFRV